MAEPAISPLPAGFDRWDELHALIMEAFAYMDGVIDPPSSAKRLSVTGLREKAVKEQGFIAMAGAELVGCLFADARDGHVYVGKLAISKGWQGRGVGAALMAAAEDHARALGKSALELQVRIELAGNHAAFSRLGFVETARTAHAGYDRPTAITMRKDLASRKP